MTEDCFGNAANYATSRWLADSIIHGLKTGLISWREFQFGTDQVIWDKFHKTEDPFIQLRMKMIEHPNDYFHFVPPKEASVLIKFKNLGIDPWVMHNGQIVRLTSIDPELAEKFQKLNAQSIAGLPILFLDDK